MIKSKFILDIFDLLFDGDDIGVTLRQQVDFLTENEYEYTGVGVFVNFIHGDGIDKCKIQPNLVSKQALSLDKNEMVELNAINNNNVINGVTIRDTKNNIEADAQVFLKDGIISSLEIWNKIGDYPRHELDNYTITQDWTNSPGRQIKKTST